MSGAVEMNLVARVVTGSHGLLKHARVTAVMK